MKSYKSRRWLVFQMTSFALNVETYLKSLFYTVASFIYNFVFVPFIAFLLGSTFIKGVRLWLSECVCVRAAV